MKSNGNTEWQEAWKVIFTSGFPVKSACIIR